MQGNKPMKITALLAENKPILSFEVFPPKTESGFDSVRTATEEIAALHPAFMSVTYGAGGGTSASTLDLAENIKARYGVPTLAHLTCVSSTHETVRERIAAIRSRGIENVMALRGDVPPELRDADRSGWDYHYAAELVRELRAAAPDLCIGGACYPEVHPESRSQAEDIRRLKEKVDAGCEFLTTQMFFDNHILYNFLYKALSRGIDVPVVAGIMPVTNKAQIKRIVSLSGNMVPPRFLAIVDRFGDNPAAMRQAGIAYATDQIIDLIANGVNHVHIYTMNKPDVAGEILDNLSEIYVRA